jgi:DNA-binding transcriptional ArsR family regulator
VNLNIQGNIPPEDQLSGLFQIIGQPARIKILLTIGTREVCVCHIVACLGLRQATISQHLMILRDASLVSSRRKGRNFYYRINQPELLKVIEQAARLMGINEEEVRAFGTRVISTCTCLECLQANSLKNERSEPARD